MAKSPIHTWVEEGTGRKTKRLTVRVQHDLSLEELIDALCSMYVRNAIEGEDVLPDSLSRDRILEVVREECKYRGEEVLWTWSEDTGMDEGECKNWARGIILGTFPEMA